MAPTITRQRRTEIGEHGQAIVELALVAPLLLVILFIAADFARLFAAEDVLANAGREAARYGSHASFDDAGIKQHVYKELGRTPHGLKPDKIRAIDVRRSRSSSGKKDIVVTTTYQFNLLTPILPGAMILNLKNTEVMPVT